MQHAGDVVIGRDEQRRRVGKRLVAREQLRVDVPVRGDYGQILDARVQATRDRPLAGIGREQAIGRWRERAAGGGHPRIMHARGDINTMDTPPPQTAAAPAAQIGGPFELLDDTRVRAFVHEQLDGARLDGASVCVIVPDATRTCPLPLLLDAIAGALHARASRLTVLVALGTHAPMGAEALSRHLGGEQRAPSERHPGVRVLEHAWWDASTFHELGTISGERVAALSDGRLADPVQVRINRAVVEHDVVLIVGPVFPHEVVGFSGGNKYLFPGVCSRELIDLSHWLGALITSAQIIGTPGITPVRALIDAAAAMVPARRLAFCVVTDPGGPALHSIAFGDPGAAWEAAVQVSAQTHVRHLDAPVQRVLSVIPTKYADLWTGAKGFYKVEPVVADGGEVVLYAPHIREISATHPQIERIGYHCRDYFLAQWKRFAGESWSDLAHSTHLRGAGTYDDAHGERCRVTVTLATGISPATVRAVNLDHLDPGAVDVDALERDPGWLVVRQAGEQLYRLR